MHFALRARQAVNLANGSTLAGLGVAVLGGGRLARSADGLFIATGYQLPIPPAPAFCLGNVIVTRGGAFDPGSRLFRHEARHATQYAWSGGLTMVPLYLVSAGVSWVLTADFGARNVFERLAGLADGGYTDKPLRPALRRAVLRSRSRSGPAACPFPFPGGNRTLRCSAYRSGEIGGGILPLCAPTRNASDCG